MSDEELARLKAVEQAAAELLPFLAHNESCSVPVHKLRRALGLQDDTGVTSRQVFLTILGSRLRAARQSQRLSMDALADLAHMSKTGIWQIETGDSEPGICTLRDLANALNVSLAFIVEGRT